MTPEARLFRWLDRAFWAVWIGFPVFAAVVVTDILRARDRIASAMPEAAACLADLPDPARFTATGQALFWGAIALHFAIYAGLLALGHAVVRDCARGRVFVAPLVARLQALGALVAAYPLVDLAVSNGLGAALAATGDLPAFAPDLALDVTVLGVGLLLLALATAMAAALRLREDADLTI